MRESIGTPLSFSRGVVGEPIILNAKDEQLSSHTCEPIYFNQGANIMDDVDTCGSQMLLNEPEPLFWVVLSQPVAFTF